jgi:hypothetical protein
VQKFNQLPIVHFFKQKNSLFLVTFLLTFLNAGNKMKIKILMILFLCAAVISAQKKIEFEEYDLDNGLHVILHQDNSTPIVAVTILYHVGSKDEDPERTGFAHFFEHLDV